MKFIELVSALLEGKRLGRHNRVPLYEGVTEAWVAKSGGCSPGEEGFEYFERLPNKEIIVKKFILTPYDLVRCDWYLLPDIDF